MQLAALHNAVMFPPVRKIKFSLLVTVLASRLKESY